MHIWNKSRQGLMVLLMVFLSACSGPTLSPLTQDSVILAFGDSLTYGKGAEPGQDYPSQLALLSGLKVINAGISGETTAEGVQRFEQLLTETLPSLVVLLEGGNDFLRNQDSVNTQANLQSMIDIAKSRGVDVVLVAVPSKQLFLSPASFYADLADINQLVLVEEAVTNLLKDGSMKSDTVHLNAAGYRVLAEQIFAHIQDAGAL
ncbi:GDSL-type esterase/lipase family protein [Shewanella waksmanii]|uniref:GDSL-type esterase/lipase family protein n=1 Tax=Shewanella waksmanii TaxID=213783 RepID=UPI00373568BB